MKELIRRIQREWRAAKDAAQAQCADSGQYEMAAKLEACDMFKGDETLEELIGLMFSPRGVEFMTAYNFPNIATFRRFKKYTRSDTGYISTVAKSRFWRLGKSF